MLAGRQAPDCWPPLIDLEGGGILGSYGQNWLGPALKLLKSLLTVGRSSNSGGGEDGLLGWVIKSTYRKLPVFLAVLSSSRSLVVCLLVCLLVGLLVCKEGFVKK